MMTILLYIYTIGLIPAFILSCALASYYEYVMKDSQDWRYVVPFTMLSWVAVVIMLINYRKQYANLLRFIRLKIRRWIWRYRKKPR